MNNPIDIDKVTAVSQYFRTRLPDISQGNRYDFDRDGQTFRFDLAELRLVTIERRFFEDHEIDHILESLEGLDVVGVITGSGAKRIVVTRGGLKFG